MEEEEVGYYMFGPHKIYREEVFYTTDLCFVMVNLRPVVPDVLVVPKRAVKRFTDLTPEETADVWHTAHNVGAHLEIHYKATSLTFTIQDGPDAGQSVPHVHAHILPRKKGDFVKNDDEIYDTTDEREKKMRRQLDLDNERRDRSFEERTQEADELRALFF